MTRTLSLLRGQIALVDDSDYPWLSQYKWRQNERGYAVRSFCVGERQITVGMHREILCPPEGHHCDHIDRNRLNNTRANLRIVTVQQNLMNRKRFKNNVSGYKGVTAQHAQFHARIQLDGKLIHLGFFADIRDAALAYDYAAQRLFGVFALLNLPGEAIPEAVRVQVERVLARERVGQETVRARVDVDASRSGDEVQVERVLARVPVGELMCS